MTMTSQANRSAWGLAVKQSLAQTVLPDEKKNLGDRVVRKGACCHCASAEQ
jgi:hypothetical protein